MMSRFPALSCAEVPLDDDIPDSLSAPRASWATNATPSVRYAGGIHGWPDATPHDHQDPPDEAPMHELPASETIAAFLLQHRR